MEGILTTPYSVSYIHAYNNRNADGKSVVINLSHAFHGNIVKGQETNATKRESNSTIFCIQCLYIQQFLLCGKVFC